MDILTILPNLSIGVVSILALAYVTKAFLQHLKEEREKERHERGEQEKAFRELEREVRTSIIDQLNENTKVFTRVLDHFNSQK